MWQCGKRRRNKVSGDWIGTGWGCVSLWALWPFQLLSQGSLLIYGYSHLSSSYFITSLLSYHTLHQHIGWTNLWAHRYKYDVYSVACWVWQTCRYLRVLMFKWLFKCNLVIDTETWWGHLIWHESLTKTWGGTTYKIWRCRALVWLKGDGVGEQAWGHGWSVANTGMIPVGCRLAMGTWCWTWWQHRRSPNTGGIDEMSGVTGGRIQKEWTSQFWVQHCAKLPVTEYSRLQWGITWLTTWT